MRDVSRKCPALFRDTFQTIAASLFLVARLTTRREKLPLQRDMYGRICSHHSTRATTAN